MTFLRNIVITVALDSLRSDKRVPNTLSLGPKLQSQLNVAGFNEVIKRRGPQRSVTSQKNSFQSEVEDVEVN